MRSIAIDFYMIRVHVFPGNQTHQPLRRQRRALPAELQESFRCRNRYWCPISTITDAVRERDFHKKDAVRKARVSI